MRIESSLEGTTFRYRIHPDADDRLEGKRGFVDHPAPFKLARREYSVELPPAFTTIHPDVHAIAIWYALRPFVGRRLELPFGVSSVLAERMLLEYGVEIGPIDPALAPRQSPAQDRPVLLFSGGMDSMAASLVFPRSTRSLFLDRIVHASARPGSEALVDLERQRDACDALRADGQEVLATRDDHEWLMDPYPMWHSDMTMLSALYLADSLGTAVFDTGEVLDAVHFGGYQGPEPTSWRFGQKSDGPPRDRAEKTPGRRGGQPYLEVVGIERAQSISGLTEVATASIVARSHRRGKSFSCYYRSETSFCMRCDKCMKKLLLSHIARNEAVPAELVEQFLAAPHPRAVFRRRYLDWHHVWYYLFQKIECDHWFVKDLQEQALAGPDLSLLEKWYPRSREQMVGFYRDEVIAKIAELVPTMSDAEVEALERLEVPPLEMPDLSRYEPSRSRGRGAGGIPGGRPDSAIAALADRVDRSTTGADLSGYRVVSAEPHDLDGSLHVALVPGEDVAVRHGAAAAPVTLILLPDVDPATPVFQRVGDIGVCYLASTPVDTGSKLHAVQAFCRRLEAGA